MSNKHPIPTSPPPGKDPPSSSPSALHSVANLETKSRDTNPNSKTPTETQTNNQFPETASKASLGEAAEMKTMPPPPKPRPVQVITTQLPPSSSSNTPVHTSANIHAQANVTSFSPSLTQSTSQNTALQDQPESEREVDAEREGEREKERPPFTPFFTLVNDISAGEQSTHHPSQVHYIFADDDVSEVLTGALIKAMDRDDDDDENAEEQVGGVDEDATNSSSSATFRRDGTRIRSERSRHKQHKKLRDARRDSERIAEAKGKSIREERVVIVDVNETGDAVTGVSSLSPSWQVLSAEIGKAPTWEKDGAEDEGGAGDVAGGLMLRIEGVGLDCGEPPPPPLATTAAAAAATAGSGAGKGKGKEREGEGGDGVGNGNPSASGSGLGEEEMQALMEGFDRKMGMLRRIVQRGSRESLVDGEKSQGR